MVSRKRLRTVLTAIGLYAVAAALIGYFWFHAFSGQRGLRAKHEIERSKMELTAELDRLRIEKGEWERRIALLRPQSIDPDMLDERARTLLNLAHPNDVVLLRRQP
jgi:cell division protein FtsB